MGDYFSKDNLVKRVNFPKTGYIDSQELHQTSFIN